MSWICYVAGKTGGHIIPGVTEAVGDQMGGNKILFITTDASLDKSIMAEYPWINKHVMLAIGAVSYVTVLGKIKFLWALVKTFIQSIRLLREYKPVKVVSMGGYVSLPVCYAAYVLRIPVIVYELNVVPGAAVKAIASRATEIRVCFAQAQKYFTGRPVTVVEYPIRFSTDDRLSPLEARRILGLDEDRFTLFVIGGSQGSRFINNFVQQLLHKNSELQVVHQTGTNDIETMRDWYATMGISAVVFAYRADLNVCYSAADRIITRAGAGSLFEVLFFKKKAVVIPLVAKTTDHQVDNARAMQEEYPDFFMMVMQEEAYAQRETIEKFLFSN